MNRYKTIFLAMLIIVLFSYSIGNLSAGVEPNTNSYNPEKGKRTTTKKSNQSHNAPHPIIPSVPADDALIMRADQKLQKRRMALKDSEPNALGITESKNRKKTKDLYDRGRKDTNLKLVRLKDIKRDRMIDARADEILVKFHKTATSNEKNALISKHKASYVFRKIAQLQKIGYRRVKVPNGVTVENFISSLKKEPLIEKVEPDVLVRFFSVSYNDPLLEEQWGHKTIRTPEAWSITQGEPSVIIGLIDSGVDLNHPDLINNLVSGYNLVDDSDVPEDDFGHGTQIAGIIAAEGNNNIGMAGVAPRCRLMPLKVLDANGEGTCADVAEAVIYAANQGCRVINLSLGTYYESGALREAIEYASKRNCVIVAAGGNDGSSEQCYPAAYAASLGVTAIDQYSNSCFFSNRANYIDVGAPGKDIHTTTLNSEYDLTSGTSAAAAHVSGLAALIISSNGVYSNDVVQAIIRNSAKDLEKQGWDYDTGMGLIDCLSALSSPQTSDADIGVIDMFTLPTHPMPGQSVNGFISVRNHGTSPAKQVKLVLKHNENKASDTVIPLIGPKQIYDVQLGWKVPTNPSVTTETFVTQLEPLEAETQIQDNTRAIKVSLSTEPIHDVTILSCRVANSPIAAGDNVSIVVEIVNTGNQDENDVPIRGFFQKTPLALEKVVDLSVGERFLMSYEWSSPDELFGPNEEVPWYSLTFEVGPVVGEKNISENIKELNFGYTREDRRVIPFHTCGSGKEVHQWIAKEAYDYFISQIEGADISSYLGTISGSFAVNNNDILEGTYAQDQAGRDPLTSQSMPFLRHFCAGGDGQEIYGGLAGYPSNYEQASNIWNNYTIGTYSSNKSLAFYRLGHVAHLLTDMCVSAHTHNDAHADRWWLGGDYDYFEKTVSYNNNFQVHGFDSGYAGHWDDRLSLFADLYSIFYRTINYTEDYPSFGATFGGEPGEPSSQYYYPPDYTHTDHHPENVDGFWPWNMLQCSWDEYLIMSKDLMPYAIRRVADLYRLFYNEVDSSDPTVSMTYPTSEDVGNPTQRDNMNTFNLTASASDSQSGILKEGYQYRYCYNTGSGWSSWQDVAPSPTDSSVPFTPSYDNASYAFYVAGENGGGDTNSSSIKYLLIQTPPSDDNYEENDTRQSAHNLSNNERTWLSNVNGLGIQADDDWYEIYVTSGYERVRIDCLFIHSEGDIDIALYNSSGNELASSEGTTDNEYIDYTVSGGGTYYIKVHYGDAGNTYDLWWDDLRPTRTLTVNSSGASSVTISSSTGHGDTTNYTKTVTGGTSVNLQAPYYVGSGASRTRFNGWTGSVTSGSQSITFTMDGNKTVTANYIADPETYTLTVNSSGASGVSISSSTGHGGTTNYTDTVSDGTSVNLQAPYYVGSGASRKRFDGWTGSVTSGSQSITFPMSTAMTVTANYVNDPVYTLTVNSSGASSVTISSSTGHGDTTNYTKTVTGGTSVNLQAPQYVGSGASRKRFDGWTGSVNSGSLSITFPMSTAMTVTANYVADPETYTLTVNSSGASSVSISSSTGHGGTTNYTDTVSDGTSVNLQAPQYVGSGASRMSFNGWTGSVNSSSLSITFPMSTAMTVTANYVADPASYTITATAGVNGVINPNGTFDIDAGQNQQFTATPDPGYTVDTWYLNSEPNQIGGTTYTLTNIQSNHTVYVTFESTISYSIVGWGSNSDGQCDVPVGNDFIDIVAGYGHGLALRGNGSLEAWGRNTNGQCDVPSGNDFIDIAAWHLHSLAIRNDGSLEAWGWNRDGQCNVPAGNDFIDIAAGSYHSLALRDDGSLEAWGLNEYGTCTVPSGNDFVKIAAGARHNLALKADGSLEAWGYNYFGQCNVPAGNDFIDIAVGHWHSLAIRADGSMAAWGSNSYGQINVPDGNEFVDSAGGWYYTCAIKSDGSLAAWGQNSQGQCNVPVGNNFVDIATGNYFGLALVRNPIYVDDDATAGANNGLNWDDAFVYLQDALSLAADSGGVVTEIRVAQGTYMPDQGVGITAGDREATFQLINGVALKGGYFGVGAADPNERDIEQYETVLSGDLNGDDGPDFANNSENSYHVFYHPSGTNLDATAILNGFTITAGNSASWGGGMYNYSSSPTVTNCTFTGNSAGAGAGMGNRENSSPTVTNCTFTYNSADGGGGMYNSGSSPTVTGCTLSGNSAGDSGGGMFNWYYSSPTVTGCTFTSNSVDSGGGGMYTGGDSSPTVSDCTFNNNSAGDGGGMSNGSSPTVTGCTFTSNSADSGGGMYNYNSSRPTVTNCILWGNNASNGNEINNTSSTPVISYCDIEGSGGSSSWETDLGSDGGGNIDVDPLFADPDGPDGDPNMWEDNDYHLLPGSPCIDAGDSNSVPLGILTDLDGGPRFVDDILTPDTGTGTWPIVDMGAYEFSALYVWADSPDDPELGTPDNPFRHIQDAIDAATGHYSIRVAAGTYEECITLNDGISLYGGYDGTDWYVLRDPNLNETVINANSLGSVVTIVDADVIIDGFTITKGLADNGGGFYCENSNLVISNCVITANSTLPGLDGVYDGSYVGNNGGNSGNGGGICCISSGLLIQDCVISQNNSGKGGNGGRGEYEGGHAGHSGNGGGIYCSASTVQIRNAILENNSTGVGGRGGTGKLDWRGNGGDSGNGGAVYSFDSTLTISNCSIENNQTGNGGDGGSMYAALGGHAGSGGGIYSNGTGDLFISDCLISENITGQGGFGGDGAGNSGDGGGIYCAQLNSFLLNQCDIRANKATNGKNGDLGGNGGSGGGSYCSSIDLVTIQHSIFSENEAGDGGLGFEVSEVGKGGGIYCSGPLIIQSSIFQDNKAGNAEYWQGGHGGGLFCGSDVSINNCLLIRNDAGDSYDNGYGGSGGNGGGIYSNGSCSVSSCTFFDNNAGLGSGTHGEDGFGGGIYSQTLVDSKNTILWENSAGNIISEQTQINALGTIVNYCCVEGLTGGWGGVGNIGDDPLFANPNNGNFYLLPGSPCIDAGNNTAVPVEITTDLDGNPRFIDDPYTIDTGNGTPPIVDMGVYEFDGTDSDGDGLYDYQELEWGLLPDSNDTDGDGLSDYDEVNYDDDPTTYYPYDPTTGEGTDLDANESDTDADSVDDFDETRWSLIPINPDTDGDGLSDYDEVNYDGDPTTYCPYPTTCDGTDPNANSSDTDVDGYSDYQEILHGSSPIDEGSLPEPMFLYVDDNALNDPEPNMPDDNHLEDGSMEHPFDEIQEAIDVSIDGDTVIVLMGTYYENVAMNRLDITLTCTDPNDADVVSNTIIDGQLLGSVVTIVDAHIIIDGFTITDGVAQNGGGIYCQNSNITIVKCVITDNRTLPGEDWVQEDNLSGGDGGAGAGIYCSYSSAVIEGCTIMSNETGIGGYGEGGGFGGNGAGIYFESMVMVSLTNCTINYNSTGRGGDSHEGPREFGGGGGNGAGMYCLDSSPTITNCEITQNTTGDGGSCPRGNWPHGGDGGNGAGIYCAGSSTPTIMNSIVSHNSTGKGGSDSGAAVAGGNGGDGAGLYCSGSCLSTIINSVISGNSAGNGGYADGYENSHGGDGGDGAGIYGSLVMINNCTIVANSAGLGGDASPGIYSQVYGSPGIGGGIRASSSTRISNSIIWDNSPDQLYSHDCSNVSYCDIQDGVCEGINGNISMNPLFVDRNGPDGNPDTWEDNDYHLKSEAGRWDPNSLSWVYDPITSPCIDGGDPNSDWTAELWPHGKRINMGAYGGTTQASMSLNPVGSVADLDFDNSVDVSDLLIFSESWPREGQLQRADFDRNGCVDLRDFAIMSFHWVESYDK